MLNLTIREVCIVLWDRYRNAFDEEEVAALSAYLNYYMLQLKSDELMELVYQLPGYIDHFHPESERNRANRREESMEDKC